MNLKSNLRNLALSALCLLPAVNSGCKTSNINSDNKISIEERIEQYEDKGYVFDGDPLMFYVIVRDAVIPREPGIAKERPIHDPRQVMDKLELIVGRKYVRKLADMPDYNEVLEITSIANDSIKVKNTDYNNHEDNLFLSDCGVVPYTQGPRSMRGFWSNRAYLVPLEEDNQK